MASSFPFALVSPERVVFEGDVRAVTLRSGGGDITFMAGHAPFIGLVETCAMRIELEDGSVSMAAVDGGFVRAAMNKVSVVTSSAELATEIEAETVLHMRSEAERALSEGDEELGNRLMRSAKVRMELAEISD
ncbi:F-type H+-transporting ATPase subunit epsilon [Ferrithrix thermotolerans DSM 19514]|uniref:ATP synthase epsilon chain n=1 Tax=Ferrithrix thermotolerans DSM 19514 TaxID=1121881 RepID=A0A1M4VAF4_9ACTN|nr:ATP synthase F1 subunit epsilon [Ferrithrix thermotolerans]SHE65798.1 F-type H+-transporting ATPase subunit epsilon [Ferrithrix thermotolerans DSM 19514]